GWARRRLPDQGSPRGAPGDRSRRRPLAEWWDTAPAVTWRPGGGRPQGSASAPGPGYTAVHIAVRIQRGGGNGPTKPRQPPARERCQFQQAPTTKAWEMWQG